MWNVLYRCTRDKNHHYEERTQEDRSPHTWAPNPPKCRLCGKVMTMAKVENLHPMEYSRGRVRRKPGGFKSEQPGLFDI